MNHSTTQHDHPAVPAHYVGIGASAGGLEAIQAFFKNMQTDSSLAFIIIQHLSPDYKSLMSELVAKITDIPVHVAQDNMLVQANNIYLIPPRKNLKLFHGHLLLTEQDRGSNNINLPIDIFFTSLAEDQGANAIGVILSGTGSDGTRGCRAIKEVGGMVMVQNEASAKFDGMPNSVIANGLTDFILAVENMPEQLMAYVKHPYTTNPEDKLPIIEEKGTLAKVYALLREKSKVDFTYYKPSTIIRRIERRMTVNQVESIEHYADYLASHQHEQNILFKELLIGVTSFFRDPEVFDSLKQEWLFDLLKQTNTGADFRIWIAGCSSGEEAYSYAILCSEILKELDKKLEIKIFATDIDNDAIIKAGNGIFPESIAADIPRDYLMKYFTHRGESYQVSRSLREMVVFAKHNIIKDPPFTNISVVSCRNMLIYLQPVLQQKVFDNFNFSLNKGGLLVLGTSETVGEAINLFHPLHAKHKLFRALGQRKALTNFGHYNNPELNNQPLYAKRVSHFNDPSVSDEAALLNSFIEGVVQDYIPCTMIVDEELHLLHVIGDASRYFLPFSGKVSVEINKNINKGLLIPISTGLTKVFKKNAELTFSNIKIEHEHFGIFKVNLRLKPLPIKKGKQPLAAVIISELTETISVNDTTTISYDVGKETEQHLIDLEQELQFSRENLQATIEELETSNEELQATNEELFTVNTEFQNKIIELTELNNDMDNFMNNADVIALFLDENMEIRKFTNNASIIFNVRSNDIGRPFAELTNHLQKLDVNDSVQRVNDNCKAEKYEVKTDQGNWYYLRIMPYMVTKTIHAGVVIILNEINQLKAAQQELVNEYERKDLAYKMLGIGTWDWDIVNDLFVCSDQVKQIFHKPTDKFKITFQEFRKILYSDNKNNIEQQIQLALNNNEPYTAKHRIVLDNGENRWVEELGEVLRDESGTPLRMIGILRDITEN